MRMFGLTGTGTRFSMWPHVVMNSIEWSFLVWLTCSKLKAVTIQNRWILNEHQGLRDEEWRWFERETRFTHTNDASTWWHHSTAFITPGHCVLQRVFWYSSNSKIITWLVGLSSNQFRIRTKHLTDYIIASKVPVYRYWRFHVSTTVQCYCGTCFWVTTPCRYKL